MYELKYLKIGCKPHEVGTRKIFAASVISGCSKCYFKHEEGARRCEMKECCMAHFRPDRTPVIFIVK